MRLLLMCSVLAVIACLAALPSVATAADPSAASLGCLGRPAASCVAALRATMRLDESFAAAALARRQRVDVNGRPLAGEGLMTLTARLPEHADQHMIVLRLNPDDTVASVEASLRSDLIPARTAEDYDRSAVYDLVTRILGPRCPGLTRIALYQFIENAVKPRLKSERRDLSAGLLGRHRLDARAVDVPYCGARFSYATHVEWTGSRDMQAGRNVAGYWSIEVK